MHIQLLLIYLVNSNNLLFIHAHANESNISISIAIGSLLLKLEFQTLITLNNNSCVLFNEVDNKMDKRI